MDTEVTGSDFEDARDERMAPKKGDNGARETILDLDTEAVQTHFSRV
jgi:hypothetical protein